MEFKVGCYFFSWAHVKLVPDPLVQLFQCSMARDIDLCSCVMRTGLGIVIGGNRVEGGFVHVTPLGDENDKDIQRTEPRLVH